MKKIYKNRCSRLKAALSIELKRHIASFLIIASMFFVSSNMQAATGTFSGATLSASKAMPICTGGNVKLTATCTTSSSSGSYTPTYQWQSSTASGGPYANVTSGSGATTSSYTTANLSTNMYYKCKITVTGSLQSGVTSPYTSAYYAVSVTSVTAPSITTQPSLASSYCSGTTNVSVSVVASGSPNYQWQYRTSSTASWQNITTSGTNATYIIPTLNNGYQYQCLLTNTSGSCSAQTTSNTVTLSVATSVTPSVTITQTQGSNPMCSGASAQFTAYPTNGGTTPTYQWKINGASVGSNSTTTTYTTTSLTTGQIVSCVMTSTASCPSPTTATSNSITMTVNSGPSISNPSSIAVCSGYQATFNTTNTSGYTYQWQKSATAGGSDYGDITYTNGGGSGYQSATYITPTLQTSNNNYNYLCKVTSGGCTTTSGIANLTVNASVTPTITISTSNTTVCSLIPVTFTSSITNGGGSPTYQWKKNGQNVSSSNSASYTFSPSSLATGDVITCTLSSNASCIASGTSPATSNSITMTVYPPFTGTETLSSTDVSTSISLSDTPSQTKYYAKSSTCNDLISSPVSTKCFVKLDLGDDYTLGSSTSFNIHEIVTITPYTSSGSYGAARVCTLQVVSSATPQAEQLMVIDFSSVISSYDYFKIDFGKMSYDASTASSALSAARISVWFDEDYKVNVNSGSYASSPLVSLTKASIYDNSNRAQFSWTPACSSFISNYQIQIMRLYNQNSDNTGTKYVKVSNLDWSKALSIEVENQTSISLELAEGTGYYIWRVRPIGDYYDGGIADSRNWGVWSTYTGSLGSAYNIGETTAEITSSTALPNFAFYFTQQDADINSIYNRAFTEGNRIAEGKSFANGLGMVKQSQRKLSELDGQILMNSTAYDYVGRLGIQSMTAPVTQDNLGYKDQLITADHDEDGDVDGLYLPQDFDSDGRTRFPDDASDVPKWENTLKMAGPISDYFSDKNSDIRIPNANNFPYSRTVYDQDGRVKKQSLFGDEHRMGLYDNTYLGGGMQRTIRTYYSAVQDSQIMNVFGNETPRSSGIYRITRVDPNENPTVEYRTVDGKLLATAYLNTGQQPLLDDVWSDPKRKIVKVIEGSSQPDPYTIVKEQSIAFAEPDITVNMHYFMEIEDFDASCIDYCSTCDYTIYLYCIREETDELKWADTIFVTPGNCEAGATVTANGTNGTKVNITLDTKGRINTDYDGTDANKTSDWPDESSLNIFLSDPGVYRFGRIIKVNNNETGESHYSDYHADAIGEQFDSQYGVIFDVFASYLDGSRTDASGNPQDADLDDLNKLLDELAGVTSATSASADFEYKDDVKVVRTEDEDGNMSYTITTNCCELTIPRVSCDDDICHYYLHEASEATLDWQNNMVTDYGEYYDFESILTDKYKDVYGSNLGNYFYDKYGKQKYPANAEKTITITLSAEAQDNDNITPSIKYFLTSPYTGDGRAAGDLDYDSFDFVM